MAKRRLGCAAFAAVTFGAVLVGVWKLLEVVSDPMVTSERHPTYAGLQGSGLIGSWLPSFLPSSAHDICEAHSVDFNDVCASFALDSPQMDAFEGELKRRGFEEVARGSDRPPYWCASTDCPGQNFCAEDAELLRGPGRQPGTPDYFAFDRAASQVCYWASLE